MKIRSILAAALVSLFSINAYASDDEHKDKDEIVVESVFSTQENDDEEKDETVVVEPSTPVEHEDPIVDAPAENS